MRKRYRRVKSQMLLRRGQSLLEVVISVAIAAILAVALVTVTLVTQRTSESAKNNTEAAKLVQEGIEQIRVFRDRNGYDALVNGDCYSVATEQVGENIEWNLLTAECLANPDGALIRLDNTAFYRKISIQDGAGGPGSGTKLITVNVTWEDQKGKQLVKSETVLSRWEQF